MAYILFFALHVLALVLVLEGVSHLLPGWWFNPLRRLLFRISMPLLKQGEILFPVKIGPLDLTPFFLAALLLAFCYYAIPWIVLWSLPAYA
jgi:hypothetical protein